MHPHIVGVIKSSDDCLKELKWLPILFAKFMIFSPISFSDHHSFLLIKSFFVEYNSIQHS